jgi:hypothetical protein
MHLSVRQVSFADDRQEMLDVLTRNFGPVQEARFNWRHIENPAGECWSWFMYDKATNATVAMATVFPRHMRVNGKLLRGGQVGEFAVDPNYRSLGPAVMLQRTTFEPVNSGELAFCYDCPPHDQGMSTFVRLGMRPNCEVLRYALPLRSEEYFAKRLGTGVWTKPLVAAADLYLRMRTSKPCPPGLDIERYERPFDDEFTDLDELASNSGTIRSSRSARDLNWRYVADPLASLCPAGGPAGKYQVFVARRGGELKAFIVFFIQSDGIATLIDLFGLDLSESGLALLETAVAVCRREGASCFHGFCSADSEVRQLFAVLGLRPRERNSRVVAYTKPKNSNARPVDSDMRWAFGQVEVML